MSIKELISKLKEYNENLEISSYNIYVDSERERYTRNKNIDIGYDPIRNEIYIYSK